ncbi:unnamed protein product [Auanema sp. JU1783]|nr:unnamed protein product [Auanema sp. JU1783]
MTRPILGIALLCILSFFETSQASWFYGRDEPDRWSVGGVWPLPADIRYLERNRTIDPAKIGFKLDGKKHCDVLRYNAENYLNKWMFPFPVKAKGVAEDYIVIVNVVEPCPTSTPPHAANENYELSVTKKKAVLKADTVWGAVRGMETLSQLIFFDEKYQQYSIRLAEVKDFPRFPVRGLMIDTSRHFLSTKVIKRQIDLMAMNKMNLLHWHLVDSEAFPYESEKFPNLHLKGAYSKRHVYSRNDVREVINYARLRGVRVMPEFDLPGHTSSWIGQEGFLTECFDKDMKRTWPNLVDPSNPANFKFIDEFLDEVSRTFPDSFLHLGGDEVSDFLLECWERNEKIQHFMDDKGFANNTDLENYFFDKLFDIVNNLELKKRMVFWQEVYDNNKPEPNSIVHVWKGNTHEEITEQVKNITEDGLDVIVSACWYLNYIKYGADWRDLISNNVESNSQYYYCDPANFTGTQEQKSRVLGGVVAIWGEFVDNTNIESRLWPRASAAAERLWSPAEKTTSAHEAWPRLHELRCRLVARGFRAQPTNWPDYCPYEFDD